MSDAISEDFDIPQLAVPIIFRPRPLSLPEDLRPSWRIGLLVLLLSACCRGAKSSRAKLHVLAWGFRTAQSQVELQAAMKGNLNPRALIVRFDPFLDRALDFAIGERLIQINGGKSVSLTPTGKALAAEIQKSDEVFKNEKRFANEIRLGVTE